MDFAKLSPSFSSAGLNLALFSISPTPHPPHPDPPGEVLKLETKLPQSISNQTISIEDELNGRQPQWKTTSM